MKIKRAIPDLLVLFMLVSCAPATVPATSVPSATSAVTIPPTSTLSPIEQENNGILALNSDGKVLFHDFDGNKLHQVVSESGWITQSRVSPDRHYIAYSVAEGTQGLWVRKLYGSQEMQLVGHETRLLFFGWAEGGNSLLYATIFGVYTYEFDSSPKKIISLTGVFKDLDRSYLWAYPSPDGQNYVVEQYLIDEDRINMFLLSIPQQAIEKLNDTPYNGRTTENGFGGWSKNGEYFHYSADTSNPDGNRRFQSSFAFEVDSLSLVEGFPNPHSLAWSPDGNWVAQSQRQDRRSILLNNGDFSAGWTEVYSISSTGGNEFNNMAWSADGQLLAVSLIDYFSPSVREVYLYSAGEGEMKLVVEDLDILPAHLYWSPDGDHLLISDTKDGATFPDRQGICKFRIYSLTKNELLNVPDVDCYGVMSSGWSTDGRVFAFTSYSTYTEEAKTISLYLLDAASGTINVADVQYPFNLEVLH